MSDSKGTVAVAHGHEMNDFHCSACSGRLNLAVSKTTACPPTHGSIMVCGWCGALLSCVLTTVVMTQTEIDALEPRERDGLLQAVENVKRVIARREAERKPS